MTGRFLLTPALIGTVLISPRSGPPEPAPASIDCEVPLRWRIESVDPEFGLTPLQAADAVRQAGMVWSLPLERPLLFQESPDGMPIRFVYDDRMAGTFERQEREAALQARTTEIETRTTALEAARRDLDRRREAHTQRSGDLQARQESHDRAVEYWNQAGGAPPAEFERLRAIGEEIAELLRALNAEAEEINRLVDEVNREAAALNAEIAALNADRTTLDTELPERMVESAEYRERRGGFLSSGLREIDVFHFESRDHLHLVLAHVLGHALGLDHSETPGSLMEETATADTNRGRPRALDDDIARLRALCPEL